jgi:LuxR family maltose regulon positive regulatory protein
VRLTRPRLLDALSSPATVVAVVGSAGSGVSTLLDEWAEAFSDDVHVVKGADLTPVDAGTAASALVIDDAEQLDPDGWVRLGRLIERHPELLVRLGLHSMGAAPAGWDIEVVRDLAFTPVELEQYAALHGARVDARAVFRATSGHVRAVRLIVDHGIIRRDRFQTALAAGGGSALPAELAALAAPRALTDALVERLGGPPDFIRRAEAAGLGAWTPGGATQPVFALTPLVRAATAAEHPLTVAETRAIREVTAEALLREHAWLEAVAEGVEAGRYDLVDAALKRGGMPLLWEHGRALLWTLQVVPTLTLRRWPVIAMVQALILNARRQHVVRAVELMGVALIGIQTSPRDSPDRALLRTIESVARRLTGFGDGGLKAARSAIRILDEMPPAQLADLSGLIGDLRVHCGISLLYAGLLDEAHNQFERAVAAPSRPGVELMAIGGTALVEALQGDIRGASTWAELAADRAYPTELRDEYVGSMLRVAEAAIAIERGDFSAAEQALDAIWPIIDTIEHWPILGYVRAQLDLRLGTADDGLERLRALRRRRGSRLPSGSPTARMLDLAEATLALAAGDATAAKALEPRAADSPWVRLGAARIAVFEGDTDRALRLLGDTELSTPADRLTRTLLEAILLRRLGRDDDAAVLARRAGALSRTAGLTTPFALLPADERALFDDDVPGAPAGLAPMPTAPRLTARERIILRELMRGPNEGDIAARLHVSVNTVKSQRRSLYRKLGAGSREEAIAEAIAHGLLEDASAPTRTMNGTDTSTTTDASPSSSG